MTGTRPLGASARAAARLVLSLTMVVGGCSGERRSPPPGRGKGRPRGSAPPAVRQVGDAHFPIKPKDLVNIVASVAENLPHGWFVYDVSRDWVDVPGLGEADGLHVMLRKWPPSAKEFSAGKFPQVEWWVVPSVRRSTGSATTAPARRIGSWGTLDVYGRANRLNTWATWQQDLMGVLSRQVPSTFPAATRPGALPPSGPWSGRRFT